jgi:hypothetical protein
MASVDPGPAVWPGITQRNRIQRNQRIGVIEANSMQDLLAGNFVRPNAPIVSPVYSTSAANDRTTNPPDYASNRIVNNETVVQRPDGSYQLIYKSNWPQAPSYGHGYAVASNPAGPFTQMTPPIFSDQGREDENHWYDAVRGKYFLLCKNFAAGAIEQLESTDAVNWTSRGMQLPRVIPWENGTNEAVEALERPQLLRDAAGEPIMLYMAARRALPGGGVESFNVHMPLRPSTVRASALTGVGDIETSGTLVQAVNFGATAPITLNGIPFAPSGDNAIAVALTYGIQHTGGAAGAGIGAGLIDAAYTGVPAFEDFLDTMVWQTQTPQAGATLTLPLTGLTAGHRYRCQLFVAESRTTPAVHGPQWVRIGGETSPAFDYGPASTLVAPGANAIRLSVVFTAAAASVPVTLTQLVAGGGGLQLAAFAVHDVTAGASVFGAGCPSRGGSNTLVAATPPLAGATFHAAGSGLPQTAIALAVSSVQPLVPALPLFPLLPLALPGCDLHVSADIVEALLTTNGAAQSSLSLPGGSALAGAVFFHQMVAIETDPFLAMVAITSTNGLRLTIGL